MTQAVIFCLFISPLDEVQNKNKCQKFQTKIILLRNNITKESFY